jgi:membrane associated rhomboid family serine protease
MLCPRCHVRLNRTKTDAGIFFDCPQCRGRAVGFPLLRRLGAKESVRTLWQDAYNAKPTSAVAGVPCPVCQRAMAEVGIPIRASSPLLQVDICTGCQFVWFDRQEFEYFPPALREEPAPMSDKARELIAIEEIKQEGRRAQEADSDDEWSPKWIPAVLGLPVEENAPLLKSWPWMTYGLAAVLVVVYLFTFQHLHDAIMEYGLIPADLWRHGGLTLITSFFLHAGFLHLLGNTYFLLVFGDNVEDDLGRWRYAALLAAATLVGNFAHVLRDPHSANPCIGASGGISGVITFYALRFPHARIGLLCGYWFYFRRVHLPAFAALFFWFLFQLVLVMYQQMGISNVAALAHLGGAAMGVAAWLYWRFGKPAGENE